MDDQGAGGSSRGNDTYPERRESSLPPTLRPHLYHAPRHASSQRIAPLVVPDWPNQFTRSRSQDHVRSLPSPSHLLRQTEHTLDTDNVWALPQPEVPVRPPRDPYAELRHSPGFTQEQRRGRSEGRETHTFHVQHWQIQAQDHREGYVEGSQRDLRRQIEPLPSQSIRERRPPNAYPANPFDEHQRLHRQQVHHQPQPQQPARFSQFLNVPGYQGGMGASSSSQSASSSRSQTISSFAGELYSEGQPEIKPFYQGSSMAEHPAIETREAVPGRKKARRSPAVRRGPRAPTEGGIAGPSTGATTSAKGKSLAKVAVACNFCRGRKLRCDGQKPCTNCVLREFECKYQPGAPRRRGPGRAPKKTRAAETSRHRQQQRQRHQQQVQLARQQAPPDHGQMSISAGSPGPSRPSPITTVPTPGIIGGGSLLAPGARVATGPRLPSQSPGASTSEMETGSHAGSRRRLSGSSVEEPERKRSRIRGLEREEMP